MIHWVSTYFNNKSNKALSNKIVYILNIKSILYWNVILNAKYISLVVEY